MIAAKDFLDECTKKGFTLFTGTPCSYLKPLINATISFPEFDFVDATNEGDAVAIACGTWLAGGAGVVMFQNSGLGNAVNPITSLSRAFEIPFLGITTLRGEPGGKPDEPQHEIMGAMTTAMLDLMQIPWEWFPQNTNDVAGALQRARDSFERRKAYFFVMRDGDVDKFSLEKQEEIPVLAKAPIHGGFHSLASMSRTEALKCIHEMLSDCALIASTGKSGRELHDLCDESRNLYMVGSMGCAPALGLGVAMSAKHSKVAIIDGDGALMMRMGNLVTLGKSRLSNLLHILLDNEVHDSTGGQKSGSEHVRFAAVASACGYQNCIEVTTYEQLQSALLKAFDVMTFIHVKIKAGSPEKLGRPKVTPIEVALRFKKYIMDSNESKY